MKHIVKVLCLVMLMITSIISLGCGSSDKFAGHWVAEKTAKENTIDKTNVFYDMVIEKNGDSYVVKINRYRYWRSEELLSGTFWDKSCKYRYKYVWNKLADEMKASAKSDGDNQIVVDYQIATMPIAYIEKDGTLLYDGLSYRKAQDDSMAKFKEKEQARIKAFMPNAKVLTGTVSEVVFEDAKK